MRNWLLIIILLISSPTYAETLTATTSLTILNVTSWKAPLQGDKYIADFPVTAKITNVTITYNRLSWVWQNGVEGLIWAFYSEDEGKTYKGWGWDYVTPNHTIKVLEGYPRGWVGTAAATCVPCKGYKARSNVYFTETY